MADRPAAEVEVTPALVRRLLTAQVPALAGRPLRHLADGWDNSVWQLGDDLLVRLPRRAAARDLVRHEQEWLTALADGVRMPIPVPLHHGVPDAGYPWPWSVVPYLRGTPVAAVPRAQRARMAPALAGFVADWHRPAPADAPSNPVRGVALATRDPAVRARLGTGQVPRVAEVTAVWERALGAPAWSGPPTWLHGDLHPFNLLTADDGTLAGVIDFGDLTAGDPATDLATAWLTFDAAGRAAFRRELGDRYPPGDPVWARARGWAVSMATSLLTTSDDSPAFRALGAEALREVLATGGRAGEA